MGRKSESDHSLEDTVEINVECFRYRRHAFLKKKGSEQVERVVTYGVQSVVTPVHHHRALFCAQRVRYCTDQLGKGYARHLLKLLHYVIASPDALPPFPSAWGAPPAELDPSLRKAIPYATAAFLWSDVGPTFYEKCTIGEQLPGYVMEEDKNRALVWKVLPSTGEGAHGKSDWEWLYESDVPDVTKTFSKVVQNDVSRVSSTSRAVIRTDPANEGTLSFLPLRAFSQASLDPEVRKKHPFGLRRKNVNGDDTIVLLTPGLGAIYGRLCITIHHNLEPDHLPSLLAKMDELAPSRGTKEGQIWGLDPQEKLAKAFVGMKERDADVHIRKGIGAHLCAVASYLPNGERVDFQDSQIWNWC